MCSFLWWQWFSTIHNRNKNMKINQFKTCKCKFKKHKQFMSVQVVATQWSRWCWASSMRGATSTVHSVLWMCLELVRWRWLMAAGSIGELFDCKNGTCSRRSLRIWVCNVLGWGKLLWQWEEKKYWLDYYGLYRRQPGRGQRVCAAVSATCVFLIWFVSPASCP